MSEKFIVGSAVDLGPSDFPRRAFQGTHMMTQAEIDAPKRKAERLAKAKDAVCREARDLLMGGYDGPCMGEEIAPLMRAVIEYDALIDAKEGK